jgi:hypothetical protein
MNLRHFHRSNTEEYQRELQELFNHKLALARSLKALTAEHEELQKVIFRNGTHYPESTDRVGTPHPELRHLIVHQARNGKHVWSYHPELSRIHDRNLIQLMGGQKIAGRNNVQLPNRLASLQKPTVSAVRSFANDLINNPDRHVMSANTDPTKPKDHSEMRVRHLISALTGSDGYEIKDHPEGFEVYAPRHSKSQKADDIATRWIYNAAKKDLRSERIYPKSPNGGSYGTKFGKSIRPRPSSNLGRRQTDARKSAAQRPRSSKDIVGKTEVASKLLKAEDEAGMTAYPLKDGYSLHHETSSNGYDIWSIGHNGQRAGSFMICTDEGRRGRPFVSWAGVDKPHRGKGIGAAVYKTLAVHYGGLDSDRNSTSVDAIKAWRRAGGRQLKIKTAFGEPRYTLEGDKKRPPIVWNEDLDKAQELNKKSPKPLKGLHAEAAKYNNFNDFKKAFLNEIKHGTYWHVTDNPNFQIDPKTGPRDMTSLGMGKKDTGALMMTSHLEHWVDFYGKKNRPYAALIDMSDVHPDDYKQVNRGFGNEFYVKNSQKAKTIKVMPVDEAIKYNQKQRKKMPQNEEELRNLYESVHKQNSSKSQNLEKTRGTLTFPKVLPKDTRPEENVKQIPKDEKAHPMHGGLYEVKPAQEQFLHTMVQGIPAEEQYRAITSIKNQIQQGTMGIYHPKQEKAFALDSDYYVKAHEAIHAMVDKVAKRLKAPSTDEVYHRMNTLIHQDDVPVLKHMLMTFGYPVSSHHRELIPFIHSILHDREMRNHYIEHLKLYRNNFDIEKRRKDIQRLGRTWNAILQTGKRVSQLSDLPKEV